MNKVFVYGIFTNEDTRLHTIGDVPCWEHTLDGYNIRTHSKCGFATVYENPDTMVSGMMLEVDDIQLQKMDKIEGISFGLYRRVKIDDHWVYLE